MAETRLSELVDDITAPVIDIVKQHDPEGFEQWKLCILERLRMEREPEKPNKNNTKQVSDDWQEDDDVTTPHPDDSVNCYFCYTLIDEKECSPADDYNDNDGGSICAQCEEENLAEKRETERNTVLYFEE